MTDHERAVEAAVEAIDALPYDTFPEGHIHRAIAEAVISAYLSALAPQAGDNAEEPVAWQYRGKNLTGDWVSWRDCPKSRYDDRERDAAFRNGRVEFRPLFAHPCTSTPVVSQNAPDLEDKGGENAPS